MISRRDLYAAGLPFGDGATERTAGRTRYGIGGDSSSSSTSNPSDRRLVAAPDSAAVTGDFSAANWTTFNRQQTGGEQQISTGNTGGNSNISIQTLDAGAIRTAAGIAEGAFDLADTSTKTAARSMQDALNLVDSLAGNYARKTGDALDGALNITELALDSGSRANAAALRFAEGNTDKFYDGLQSISAQAIRTAERAQSDVVGAYREAADTSSGARQLYIGGMVIAGIVAVAVLGRKWA